MPAAIKRRDITGTPLRQIGWLRYDDGLGRLFGAVDYPRLTYITRSRGGATPEAFWLVDGAPVLELDDAVDLLNEPPELSEEEIALFHQIPEAWTLPAELRAIITDGLSQSAGRARTRLLRSLSDKGLLEVDDARIRRRRNLPFRVGDHAPCGC